jgi:outer membrane protein TolC
MSRTLVRALPLLLAILVQAIGQTPPVTPTDQVTPAPVMPVAPAATSTPAATEKPFTLEDAIALAMRKNFDLQVQSYTVANAKDTIAIQDAAFDPTISATARRSLNQQASTTSRLDGTLLLREGPRSDNTVMSVGASLPKLPATNGSVSVTANVQRAATNSQNALVNPSFTSGVSANLNQPLLNGAGRHMATAALSRAKLGLNIANINYKSRVLSVIADTENAFFNLVAAREALRIRQFTLQSNQRLLDENQARRTTGVATDLDVLSADYGVANARRGLVQAEQTVRDAEDRLLNLINVPEFDQRVGPVAFSDYKEGVPSFAVSYKRAREYYPETLSTEQAIKQLELDLETARRNQQPDLNLTASLGYGGLATSEGYSQAISNLPQEHGNNWALGLNYSMPWGRHADKARYRTAQSNLTSRKLQLEQLEQTLLVNVRTAVRAVESNITTAEIASKATELAVRQYEQQKARYDAGLSTSRLVLLAQDDVENARFQELSARLSLRRAVTELRRLEGTSIDYFKVMLPGT